MANKHKAIRHRIEYAVVLGLLPLVGMIPLKSAYQIADVLAWLAFHIFKIRRDVTLSNLARAFPEKSDPERIRIARKTYVQFARTFVELLRFPAMKPEAIQQIVQIRNAPQVKQLIESSPGTIMVTGHFGNWELMGAAIAQLGVPLYVVAQKQSNDLINRRLHQVRTGKGIHLIYRGLAVRQIPRVLKQRGCVGFVADQDAGPRGVFVDFFGVPSSTHQGAAVYCLRTGAMLFFGVPVRRAPGRIIVEYEVLNLDHLQGVTEENVRKVTQIFTTVLEKWIRKYPEHYNWMHRRWKTTLKKGRPPGR